MKHSRNDQTPRTLLRGVLTAWLCMQAAAANAAWYSGGGIGTSANQDYDCFGCGSIANVDDDGTAFKLFGGFRWHRFFATQIGFAQLADTTASGPLPFSDLLEVNGVYLSAVGILPIGDHFELFATTGAMRWDQDVTYNGQSGGFRGTDLTFSVGAGYNFTIGGIVGWAVQLEAQQFNDVGTNDPLLGHLDDYRLLTLNVQYRF
jgi:OmpA-OmpF porin, OOP family